MKRFTILIAAAVMLLAIMLQPVRLWGQEKTDNIVYTLSITKNTSNTGYANNYDITVSSKQWSAPGNQGLGAYIKIGGKLSSATDRYLYSKTAISENINKVIVTHGSKDSQITVNSMTLKVYSTAADAAADTNPIATVSTTYTDNGTSTFTKPNNDDWSGCFYRINYNLSSSASSKNYGIIFTKAEFYTTTFTLTYSATNGSISGVLYGTSTAVSSGGSVNKGGKVTLTATPASGYLFTSWEVSGTGSTLSSTTTNPTTFTMGTANATVTANFLVASGYITVSPTTATPTCAAEDVVFFIDTDQTLDDNPVVFYTTSTGDETTEKPAWIGDILYDEGELLVEVNANIGAARTAYFRVEKDDVKSDVITINQAVYAPAAPIIPATTSFDYTMNVTMSQEAGKTIYYTTDGSTPSNTSTEYTGTFDINATTTVKAIAYDGTYPSAVVSATYTRIYDYISSIDAPDKDFTVKGTVVATNSRGFIIGDGTGYVYYYKGSSVTQSITDIVALSGTTGTYGNIVQFTSSAAVGTSISSNYNGTPAATLITEVPNYTSGYHLSTYFQFAGELTMSGSNYFIAVGSSQIQVSYPTDSQTTILSALVNKIVRVKGYFSGINSNSKFTVMLESVEACPVITPNVISLTGFTCNISDGNTTSSNPSESQGLIVNANNLTNDITVSLSATSSFEMSEDNSTFSTEDITISRGSGSVSNKTIYVRLKSGLASGTYTPHLTLSSDGAEDVTVSLNGTVKHVIAYNGSITGGTVSSEPNSAAVTGATVNLTATEGSGYKFSEWDVYKTGDATIKVPVSDNAFTMPNYNVTVSATFVEAYSVTYDANGGSGEMSDSDSPYASGSTVKVLDNDFTREGYSFSRWNTKSDGSGDFYDANDEFTINVNTTLYAQWTRASYAVTLSSVENVTLSGTYGAEGTIAETETKSIPYGTAITLSATGLASGKTFVWSVTKNEDSSDVTDDVIDGDILTVPAYAITIGGSVEDVTAVYTVTSTSAVSSSGIIPTGSTASYSSTYNSNYQLTNGNSMTLTLSGYQNQIVKKVVLYMRSNGKAGAGSFSVMAGTTTLKSFDACAFSDDNWNGSYTTSYTDVEITMSNSTYKIEDDEDLVITIAATENSLYCQRFTIYYETSTTPVINAENVNLLYSATSGEIPYTITNPNGSSLTAAKTSGDWISGVTVDGVNSKVTFTTTANTGEGREGTITLSYTGASDKVIKVYQEAQKFTVTYAAGTGGSGTMTDSNSPYEYGAEVTLLDNTFTAPSGKMFNEWAVTDGLSNPVSVSDGKFTMPNSNVTVTAQWRDKLKYALVTNINQLIPGKHYIFVGKDGENYYAMGKDRGNNRLGIGVSVDGEGKIAETTGLYEFVISGSSADYWTIYDSNTLGLNEGTDKTGYLYAAGGTSSNYLKTQTTNDNKGQWLITIASGTNLVTIAANISTTGAKKYMRYNHNSGNPDLFSCYNDNDANVYIYVRDGDNDCEINSATTISSGTTTISGDMNIVSGIVTIQDGATLKINGTLTNNTAANLVIEDGGQLITSSAGVKATVKKEIHEATAKDATYWYAISSAVANPSIASATNLTTGTYDLYRYNEAATATNAQGQTLYWENYKAGHADFTTLEPGRGYLYRNASTVTIEMAGEVNVAAVNYPVTKTGEGELAGFNLIGNPYSHDIYKGDGTAIPNGSGLLRTGFYYMDPDNGSWTPGTDGITAIKPNEGILVQTDKSDNIKMTNTNSNGAKYNNDNIMFKVANSQYSDEAYAWFDKGRGLNKISHRNAEVPMIYINQDGEDYAIATMSDDTKMFSLNFKAMTMGKYTLSYKTKGEFNYLHVIDRFTGVDVDMLLEGEYSFVASPSDSDARFIVKLAYLPDYGDGEGDIFAYQNGSDIFVSGEGELQIFDVMGRFVMSERINGVKTISADELSKGVYVLRLVGNGMKTQKIIIK